MPKLKPGTLLPGAAEDTEITRAAKADSDARPLTAAEWHAARKTARVGARPGRPPAAITRERITIRLSPDVVARFRASGAGWQTRMDAALKDWLKTHSPGDDA